MTKPLNIVFWSLLLYSSPALSQASEYQIQVNIISGDGKAGVAENVSFLLNGTKQTTNKNGMVYITFDNKTNPPIRIASMDEREYTIIGSEIIYFPPDPNIATIISMVRSKHRQEIAAKEVNRLYEKLKIQKHQTDSMQFHNNILYKEMLKKQDSIFKMVMKNYRVTEADLRSASELLDGRDKYFRIISENLESYLNEAKDIKDVFENLVTFSLQNPKSFQLLDSTINVYNKVYNELNNKNAEYERAILDYWKSYELSMGYHNVVDFSLNNIHRASILPLNSTIIMKANMYLNEKSRQKRNALKQALTKELNTIIPMLGHSLGILDTKVKTYVGNLKIKKDFLTD